MLLITYDVNTTTAEGRLRLRHVACTCKNYGQRVQNSVFECRVTPAQAEILEDELRSEIDKTVDSLRIYNMGSGYRSKIKHIGAKVPLDLDGTIIF